MKKFAVALSVLISVLMVFTSCNGNFGFFKGDKNSNSSEQQKEEVVNLPNGYKIAETGKYSIELQDSDGKSVPFYREMYIYDYCNNERYIAMKVLDMRIYSNDDDKEQELNDKSTLAYYIYDTQEKRSVGPLNEGEYKIQTENIGIQNLNNWKK